MRFEEDSNNDYFDGNIPEEEEPVKVREPKKPALKPDDPRYWDQDEPEFEHLKPRNTGRIWWWTALAGVVVGLLFAAYVVWFAPYSVDGVQYGYIENIEQRGLIFKSYEGVLLPYKNLMDTNRVYEGDFVFSTKSTPAAVTLRRMQYANKPVRVVYRRYRSVVPWRGDTRILVTSADTVDPHKILPPDRQPQHR